LQSTEIGIQKIVYPSGCTMVRIDFIDPKRLTNDLPKLHEATTYGLATPENERNIAGRVSANIFKEHI
jgi:hypothetical protein